MHGNIEIQCGGNQDAAEFARFLELVRSIKAKRYLEIGCRNGETFSAVMRSIGQGGYGLAIDLPENKSTHGNLRDVVSGLQQAGIGADVIFANSHFRSTIDQAIDRGPFDLILIDAGHQYDDVRKDFENYSDLAPVIVIHDVDAPDGHMSDGYPNEVGRFWREIKGQFETEEFITPGSNMGFGVIRHEMKPLKPRSGLSIFVAVPAWGEYYVDLACRFTIPGVLASLAELDRPNVTFIIHTDNREPFKRTIGEHKIDFHSLRHMSAPNGGKMARLPDNFWWAFKQAHKDAIAVTPPGQLCCLLNSDIVMSRECFPYVARQVAAGKKAVVSVGIRTQIEDNPGPPIGATADELFQWIWGHRHHITEECIWDHGRSEHPTILFFEDAGNVAMHCFHLTPMFIVKDRNVAFKGTIDDDLLGAYCDDEVSYISGGDVAFAEISPNWKTHPFKEPLNVRGVLDFWSRRMVRPHYLRNFKQRMRVLGNPTANHPAADHIIQGLQGRC